VVFRLALAPLYVGAAAVLLVVLTSLFVRLGDGRYAENLIAKAMRIRRLRRLMMRSYIRDLAKADPVAARAFAKVERLTAAGSVSQSKGALSVLTPAERRAYLDLFDEQGEPLNRAQRRRTVTSRALRPHRSSDFRRL